MRMFEYFVMTCYGKERFAYYARDNCFIFQALSRERVAHPTPVGSVFVLDPWCIAINGIGFLLAEEVVIISDEEAVEILEIHNRICDETVGVSGNPCYIQGVPVGWKDVS